jgi:dihydropteroate synthase
MLNDAKAPLIMGILNVTPDSFSDGGLYLTPGQALKQAETLVREGADILDVGGESSRPGATPVSVQEELDRVIPVIQKLHAAFPVRLSIDTSKPEVAAEAIKAGVSLINDITGGQNIGMAELVKRPGVDIILMHMRGTPASMQVLPLYPRGVIHEVTEYLTARVAAFTEMGVAREQIWVDPGIGFGKALGHNLELLHHVDSLSGIGSRLVIGTSRKSFLAHVLGNPQLEYEMRESGTIATNLWAYQKGASVFRVHDVGNLKRALVTWRSIENGR